MYVASVQLTRAWLTNALDPEDALISGTMRESNWTYAIDGGIRQLASGRRQGQRNLSTLRTSPVTFVGLDLPGEEWLEDHAGTPLLFRSRVGERIFCTYYQLTGKHTDHSTLHDGYHITVSADLYEIDL